ncbi:FadR/GntR family transcriptional regulator [Palleronia pelagia]|uniref:FadR/GntR family transcriptional regulator n=1 Tax=Palleronia pelagia TaxID=387096 RepID=UPI000A892C99|nr:FCD domain-containing protein [Palleronia pelagia]
MAIMTDQTQPIAATQLIGDLPRRTVRDLVAEKIATLISSGVLAPGDELPGERELAASLSVSRETVRGAIGILAGHGILRVTHGARTAVASADTGAFAAGRTVPAIGMHNDLSSVYEARLLIERYLARRAANLVDAALLNELQGSLDAQRACGGDAVRFLLCDRDFHSLIYQAGGNEILSDTAMILYNHLLEFRRRIVSSPGAIQQSIAEHTAIVDALGQRDADAVERAVTAHTNRIHETTRAFLKAKMT